MHPSLLAAQAGTRLPALVLQGRPVPATGARWTLLVLGPGASRAAEWHRRRLAAEAVATIALPEAVAPHATVLVDPQGVVQFVGGDVEETLDAVRDLRVGDRLPVAAARSLPEGARRPCGRTARSRSTTTRARRSAH